MRRLLPLLLLILSLNVNGATLTDNNGGNQAFGTTLAVAVTAATGDLLVMSIRDRDGNTPTSVSSDLDGALTLIRDVNDGVGDAQYMYYLMDATSGTNTVTVTYAGNSVFAAQLYAFAGIATSTALDQSNEATNSAGTSHNHGSITTTGAGVIFSGLTTQADPDTITPGSDGFTMDTTHAGNRLVVGYKLSTGAETVDNDLTSGNSVSSAGIIASFLDAAGGGGATIPIFQHHQLQRMQ